MLVEPPLLEKPSVAVQTVPIRKITQFKDWNTNLGENWVGGGESYTTKLRMINT